jgi:hypothetical protein
MPVRPLPRNPDLKLLNDQARNLLRDCRQGNAPAMSRYFQFDSLPDTFNPRLADVQHMIALEYGYTSWPKLKQHVDAMAHETDIAEELVGL